MEMNNNSKYMQSENSDSDELTSYNCNMCNYQTEHKPDLLHHEMMHENIYVCNICRKVTNNIPDLISHLAYHNHLTEDNIRQVLILKNFHKESIKCELCDMHFSKPYKLRNHLYKHINYKPYKCDSCIKSFNNLSGLKRHTKSCHHENINTFKKELCTICEKSYSNKKGLLKHSLIHQSESFKCNLCHKIFALKRNLDKHALTHTKSDTDYENIHQKNNNEFDLKENKENVEDFKLKKKHKVNQKSKIENDIIANKTNDKNNWKCDICGKGFVLVTKFKNHEASHGKIVMFDCDLCEKTFDVLGDLYKHAITHKKQVPLQCESCGKLFATKYNLTRHCLIHVKNTIDKSLTTCTICNQKMNNEQSLEMHMLQHQSQLLNIEE